MDKKDNTDIAFKTTGCTWLSSVSDQVGVPLDQVSNQKEKKNALVIFLRL